MLENLKAVEQADSVETAARLADHFRQHPPDGPTDFPVRELLALADAGLLGAALPIGLGGAGLGVERGLRGNLLPVLKEIGRGNLPLGRVFEGHVNALLLLHAFGSDRLMARVADDVLQGGHVFGVWNTGPAQSPQLTPMGDGSYRMSGAKTFATGVGRIQKAIVTASLPDGGWQMCLVPLTDVNLRIRRNSWEPLGMEATESYAVEFPNIALSEDALIGQPGDYYAEPTFTSGALRFCAVQLGGAQALFTAAAEFAKVQGRGDNPFQLQRLGQMAVLMESGDQWLARACDWLEASFLDSGSLAVRSQMMRIATEEICTRVMQLVEVSVGARGLTSPEPFARTVRDLQMYLRQAGFDEAFQGVGRHVIREQLPRG